MSPSPTAFDLPPGRLAQRRAHLIAEIAASTTRPRPARSLRVAVALALFVLAGTVVNVAFGLDLGARLTELVAGKDAPEPIERRLVDEAMARRIVPLFAGEPTVDGEAAHGVMAIETAIGPFALWTVPTHDGPICSFVETVSRSESENRPAGKSRCSPRPSATMPIDWWRVRDAVRGRTVTLVAGVVHESVASVWVQAPSAAERRVEIAERFFLADVSDLPDPQELVARDGAGQEIGRRTVTDFSAGFQEAFSLKQTGPERTVISTRDHKGRLLTLTLRPAEGGQVCLSVESGLGAGGGSCMAPEKLRVDEGISVHPTLAGSIVYLNGSVGPGVKTLTLEYEDGSVVALPIVERFVLVGIARSNFHEGAQPRLLVGKDARGREVARSSVSQRVFEPDMSIWLPGDVSP